MTSATQRSKIIGFPPSQPLGTQRWEEQDGNGEAGTSW
jgi:hypothetical protein